MNFVPAICPACGEIILCKARSPFLACPLCKDAVSSSEAIKQLDNECAKPAGVRDMISTCLELEDARGTEIPLQIMEIIARHHPHNEEAMWLVVRMSKFAPNNVKKYLMLFSAVNKTVPWAEDFLANALKYQNMEWANMFEQFIENKLPSDERPEFRKKLFELRRAYSAKPSGSDGRLSLYVYYIGGAALNIALLPLFLFIHLAVYFLLLITVAAFAFEIFLLFLHNRRFGNRVGINDTERLLMVIFLCSIMVGIGAIVLGGIFTI